MNQDLSLLILDVDDFKDYNDAYGHPEGDRVLVQLARAIEKGVRESDVSCRYGGEEFLIILPGAGASNAHTVAEKIRKRFAATVFKPRSETVVSKTVSLGVAQLKPKEAEEDLIRRADVSTLHGQIFREKPNLCRRLSRPRLALRISDRVRYPLSNARRPRGSRVLLSKRSILGYYKRMHFIQRRTPY